MIIQWQADPTEASVCTPSPILHVQKQLNDASYRGTAYISMHCSSKSYEISCGSQCFLIDIEGKKINLQSAEIMNSQFTNPSLTLKWHHKLFLKQYISSKPRLIPLCEQSRQIKINARLFFFKQNYSVSSLNLTLCHQLKIRIIYFCCLVN